MTTALAARQDPVAVFDDPVFRAQLHQVVRSTFAASRGFAADAFLLSSMAPAVPVPGRLPP